MAGKTLSNGTLSLRFMQNAHRAKLQAQVESEQAKVRDDAEWSVPQEVRDAWGLGASSSKQEDDVHEPSYLPFIFQLDKNEASESGSQADVRPAFRGRRTFNAKGKEVLAEPPKPREDDEVDEQEDTKPDVLPKPRSKFEPLPTSISSFNGPIASTRRDGKRPAARTKTAQELIRDSAPIRPPASLLEFADAHTDDDHDAPESKPAPAPTRPRPVAIPPSAGFVRPAGVDAPAVPAASVRKRDREQGSGAGTEGKKRKKRREASS
ncbi:hypothetical protein GSI_11624 [Ganoderma sinense ZZ0214-1]|uniref:Uncharacterized protein n=1 Tax=Ganoderma sinense ZZ0214-1 TaxID=1077348 RepID=A0A2G8RWI1_9APHY|nr:hypothetical protein GSI_11624 [Ganoderma sinense ZZ0214-1]